jgi:hypothetical protein
VANGLRRLTGRDCGVGGGRIGVMQTPSCTCCAAGRLSRAHRDATFGDTVVEYCLEIATWPSNLGYTRHFSEE